VPGDAFTPGGTGAILVLALRAMADLNEVLLIQHKDWGMKEFAL